MFLFFHIKNVLYCVSLFQLQNYENISNRLELSS